MLLAVLPRYRADAWAPGRSSYFADIRQERGGRGQRPWHRPPPTRPAARTGPRPDRNQPDRRRQAPLDQGRADRLQRRQRPAPHRRPHRLTRPARPRPPSPRTAHATTAPRGIR
ncbi:hypothetical protein ACW23B_11770 [Streptomyces albidoflavus]